MYRGHLHIASFPHNIVIYRAIHRIHELYGDASDAVSHHLPFVVSSLRDRLSGVRYSGCQHVPSGEYEIEEKKERIKRNTHEKTHIQR